jgi:hypothetical protein
MPGKNSPKMERSVLAISEVSEKGQLAPLLWAKTSQQRKHVVEETAHLMAAISLS